MKIETFPLRTVYADVWRDQSGSHGFTLWRQGDNETCLYKILDVGATRHHEPVALFPSWELAQAHLLSLLAIQTGVAA